jgi:hypothetical protein
MMRGTSIGIAKDILTPPSGWRGSQLLNVAGRESAHFNTLKRVEEGYGSCHSLEREYADEIQIQIQKS